MPQELALYNAFTVEETLQFFARLYLMDPQQCKARSQFLVGLLDLPRPEAARVILKWRSKAARIACRVADTQPPHSSSLMSRRWALTPCCASPFGAT
ncbi:hypothetical protein MRX96_030294 [Rhipicephalus microplus]